MSKSKFSLTALPTFKRKVGIPVAGSKPVEVEFTFKHKTRDEYKAFIEGIEGREDVDVILEIASGWDLEEAFDDTSLDALTQNYIGSARAIITAYINELTDARLGN